MVVRSPAESDAGSGVCSRGKWEDVLNEYSAEIL